MMIFVKFLICLYCERSYQPHSLGMKHLASIPLSASTNDTFLQQGFIHVEDVVPSWICGQKDFLSFKKSWNTLPADNYLNGKGKYRYRRYAVFHSIACKLSKLPLEPHYQRLNYNHLHGGLYRHFCELKPAEIDSPILRNLIEWNLQLISSTEQKNWRIQCHQFRICATRNEAGKPSPEGIHQDGADYVFIMLLDRHNVTGASNTIHDESGRILFTTTLREAGESLLVNDKRYWHGVSDIYPKDKAIKDAYRDVLVMSFHHLKD